MVQPIKYRFAEDVKGGGHLFWLDQRPEPIRGPTGQVAAWRTRARDDRTLAHDLLCLGGEGQLYLTA